MKELLTNPQPLADLCGEIRPSQGMPALENALRRLMPELDFRWAITRGHWHRLGGVVNGEYQRVSENIAHWAEEESDGDVDELIAKYQDANYYATHWAGRTHYLAAPTGENPEDYLQLEVEELQEAVERPLVPEDWFPDSLEEFLEPLDVPHLSPQPIGAPIYRFRRITHIADLLTEKSQESDQRAKLRRFFADWQASSAQKATPFCRQWVLELRQYMDRDGECRLTAKPVTLYAKALPTIPAAEALHGVELANAIHGYDRQLGYPFAWYFILLACNADNYKLAEAVLQDQSGEYDYLPQRDLQVLKEWALKPYAI